MLFLIGAEMLAPIMGVKVDVVLPYAPYSTLAAGLGCFIIAYYIFRSN